MEKNTWSENRNPKKKAWHFYLPNEPEALHVIRSGFKDLYFYFYEDAFQLEPWHTGIKHGTKKEIEELFKIQLSE